jgi:hypothetical protein
MVLIEQVMESYICLQRELARVLLELGDFWSGTRRVEHMRHQVEVLGKACPKVPWHVMLHARPDISHVFDRSYA